MPRKRVLKPEVLSPEASPASAGQERFLPARMPPQQGEDRSLPMLAEDKVALEIIPLPTSAYPSLEDGSDRRW